MSSRSGRTPSGPWGRLKPVNVDPLEEIGLPSKGDNRLLDHRAQERYYTKIVERYMAFCSEAGRGDELRRRMARMGISHESSAENQRPKTAPATPTISMNTMADNADVSGQKDLSVLIMAMRKLREGIVASKRVDDFSIQAYIFCIRLSILVKHMESYHPAILHLLKRMHTVQPLTSTEVQEFVGYWVLDLACRQNELSQAYLVRREHRLRDPKVDALLRALTHDNYYLFWRVKRSVDGHKAKLMEFAEDMMKRQALKCLGRSYLSIDLSSVELYTNTPWPLLAKEYGVGWQLEGTKSERPSLAC
ncbi:uncharacterized protein L3040_003046 [Drepanopeziza brunnea f. sp. 'multigermtubi']|uniref:uncharacterized protein n=1 Tax=Drepanopeziza brunnea f. sp. 'multigermtubi' TaxID=698441 RepID=UPI002398CC0C|nr:hypothetical protein L3040_003046 [Drepanopeziza brunnea f. sp. 'multigermtubi']